MSLLNTHPLLIGQALPKPAGGGGNVINAVPRFEQRAILAELKKMGISPNQLEAVPGSNKQLIRFKHGNNWIVVTTVGLLAALTLINEYGPGGMAQFRRMQRINGQLSHAGRQLNIPLAVVLGDNDVSPNFITAAEQNVLDNFNRALRANNLSAEGFSQLVQNNINSIHRIEENVQHAVNTRPTDAGGGQVAQRTQALANLTGRINKLRLGEHKLPVSATGQREGTNYVIRMTVPGGRTPGGLIKPISPERFGQEMAAISNRTQALENWANNNYQGRPQGWTLDETQLQDPESVMRAVLGLPSLQNPQHGTPLRPQPLPPNAPVASGGSDPSPTQGVQGNSEANIPEDLQEVHEAFKEAGLNGGLNYFKKQSFPDYATLALTFYKYLHLGLSKKARQGNRRLVLLPTQTSIANFFGRGTEKAWSEQLLKYVATLKVPADSQLLGNFQRISGVSPQHNIPIARIQYNPNASESNITLPREYDLDAISTKFDSMTPRQLQYFSPDTPGKLTWEEMLKLVPAPQENTTKSWEGWWVTLSKVLNILSQHNPAYRHLRLETEYKIPVVRKGIQNFYLIQQNLGLSNQIGGVSGSSSFYTTDTSYPKNSEQYRQRILAPLLGKIKQSGVVNAPEITPGGKLPIEVADTLVKEATGLTFKEMLEQYVYLSYQEIISHWYLTLFACLGSLAQSRPNLKKVNLGPTSELATYIKNQGVKLSLSTVGEGRLLAKRLIDTFEPLKEIGRMDKPNESSPYYFEFKTPNTNHTN